MTTVSKRVLIVGGVAGGATCAARLRRMDEHAEIIVFEMGPYVSYANCGLPYHTSGVIADEAKLLLATPALFASRYRVDVRTRHEVVSIDRTARTVQVLDHSTGKTTTEAYDALVLSPGADAIKPPVPGIDREGVFVVRTVPDARAIREWIAARDAKRAVVIGAGYIGIEMVENLVHRGIKVTLIERLDQVLPIFDAEMMRPVEAHLREKGVDVRVGAGVTGLVDGPDGCTRVKLGETDYVDADIVVLGTGVKPRVGLAKDAGLAIGQRGGIRVDGQMRTSDPSIFAVGDAVETRDAVTGAHGIIALAGPANRQGRLVADAICGRDVRWRGTQGTAVVGVFDLTAASTGPSERQLLRAGVPYEKAYLFPAHHVGYYPGAQVMHLKILFRPSDGRLLGAQAVGRAGVDKRIDVLATFIQMRGTVHDLEEAELCYAPQYGSAKDPVNMAGFVASNHLRGDAPLAHWDSLAEERHTHRDGGPFVLDVREPSEYAAGAVPGSVNIPLGSLRDRLAEVPKDRPVWAHCRSGQRSHTAVRILRQNGYDAHNLTGGWLEYETEKG